MSIHVRILLKPKLTQPLLVKVTVVDLIIDFVRFHKGRFFQRGIHQMFKERDIDTFEETFHCLFCIVSLQWS